MRLALFCHSLYSDWNHGNAHFLRGVTAELRARGHEVLVFEPRDSWSATNLMSDHGAAALFGARDAYPWLASTRYDLAALDLDRALEGVDVVLVHEWNDPALVRRLGERRRHRRDHRLLFHDTHHRAVTNPGAMSAYHLEHYDGVLAFGRVLAEIYGSRGWARRAWTWHEAADIRVFRPAASSRAPIDVVWIGNWGDGERTRGLQEYLFHPVRVLRLTAEVHGVRYPEEARRALDAAGIRYRGWLPNHRVPEAFAGARVTVHVPRGPYAGVLPGIPTIRPFEALACGIPLVSAPWADVEGLFTPGKDYWVARSGKEMESHLHALLSDPAAAKALAEHGLQTVLSRHTCAHRVDELLRIVRDLDPAEVRLDGSPDIEERPS